MSRETHMHFYRRFSVALRLLVSFAGAAGIALGFGEVEMATCFGVLAVLCILPTAYFGWKTEQAKDE